MKRSHSIAVAVALSTAALLAGCSAPAAPETPANPPVTVAPLTDQTVVISAAYTVPDAWLAESERVQAFITVQEGCLVLAASTGPRALPLFPPGITVADNSLEFGEISALNDTSIPVSNAMPLERDVVVAALESGEFTLGESDRADFDRCAPLADTVMVFQDFGGVEPLGP